LLSEPEAETKRELSSRPREPLVPLARGSNPILLQKCYKCKGKEAK